MGAHDAGTRKAEAAMTTLILSAAVGLLLGAAPAAYAEPFEHGEADTFTLTGPCDGVPTVVTHGPGSTTTAFVAGRATIARRLVFYAGDGVTVAFVHQDPSYSALADQLDLQHCDLVSSLTGNRVEAWVQVPASASGGSTATTQRP